MATTKKGIYYPTDYTKPADVPDDMKKLAESVDEAIGNIPQYDDTGIKKDISDLKKEQSTQNKQISDNSKKNIQQDTEISKLQTRVQQLQANMINETTDEATSLHVTDAAELPARLEVRGNHRQETREGYNIFDYLSHVTASINGLITTTDKEGYIIVNGTPTAGYTNIVVPIDITDLLEDNTTYTLWQDSYSETKYGGVYLQCNIKKKSDSSITYLDASTQKTTFTVNKSQYTYTANLQIGTTAVAGTFSNYKNRYMIYKGTDSKEYEKFGVSPSIDYPSEIQAVGDNINIFDGETETGGYSANTGNKNPPDPATIRNVNFINVENLNTVMFSCDGESIAMNVFEYDTDKTFIKMTFNAVDNPFELDENTAFINFSRSNNIETSKIKIEQGSKVTPYSPYGQGSVGVTKTNSNVMPIVNLGTDWEYTENGIKNLAGNAGKRIFVINVKKGQTIKFGLKLFSKPSVTTSFTVYVDMQENTSLQFAHIHQYNLNQVYTRTYTATQDCQIRSVMWGNANNETFEFQLWANIEEQKDYVRYAGEEYVLPIQQPMLLGDYFEKETDGWKEVHLREKRLIKDSISNAYSSASKNSIYISQLLQDTAKIPANNNEDALMLSNFAIHATQAELTSASIDYGIALSDTGSLCIRCKNLSTVDEYKTALNNDSYYYYYYLATPTKLACTEAQSQVLDQLSELPLFKGINNVTADDLALLQMTYTVDTKAYIDSKLGSEG